MKKSKLQICWFIYVTFVYVVTLVSSTPLKSTWIPVDKKIEDFTFNLYDKISEGLSKDENMVFSPISIYSALSLVGEGANNRSRTQIQNAIKETELMKIGPFNERTFRNNPSYALSVANRLFVDNSLQLNQTYIDNTELSEAVERIDFQSQPESSRQKINDWVRQNTLDQIDELLEQEKVTSLTRFCLVNAVALEAEWDIKFKKVETLHFYETDDKKKWIEMLTNKHPHRYNVIENSQLTLLHLPYKGGKIGFTAVMPNRAGNFSMFDTSDGRENLLTTLKQLWTKPSYRRVKVAIPKLKFEHNYKNLKDDLVKMGITDIFDAELADFSRLYTGNEPIYVSDVVHKANFELDQNGVKASAATAFLGTFRSASMFPTILIDKPFLFFVRNEETGAILFMGKVVSPTEVASPYDARPPRPPTTPTPTVKVPRWRSLTEQQREYLLQYHGTFAQFFRRNYYK